MATGEQKSGKKRGRPAWTPPDLSLVKGLAMQGMTDEKIAETLGISIRTLYRKKAQLSQFRQAIKGGFAESEAVATSKLFEAVKKGEAWAICFFLKARHGWQDWAPAGVNVNVGIGGPADEERQAAMDRQRALLKLATPEEIAMYRRFLQRLLIRQQQKANQGAVQTTAEPVASNGAKPEDTE